MPIMAIPWPEVDSTSAILFGMGGLFIGWLSYRAGLRAHDSQLRVEAMTLANAARLILDQAAEEQGERHEDFKGLYAATGRFYSGAMEVKSREFLALATTIELLRSQLGSGHPIDRLSGRRLETRLVNMRSIHAHASSIRDKLTAYEQQIREDRLAVIRPGEMLG